MLFATLSLVALSLVPLVSAAAAELTLGYPTKIRAGPGASNRCVLKVTVPLGSTTLRIYADKGWDVLNFLGGMGTSLYAGWDVTTNPTAVASGSVSAGEAKGDVMLTLDVKGKPGPYWILVESENAADVWVSAVAYDLGQRPRVSVELGRRTGIIAVEQGASQIFRVALPANKATTLYVNIDAGYLAKIGEAYDVFVNILDDKKLQAISNGINLGSIGDFLNRVGMAFMSGNLDQLLPKYLTPDETTHDLQLSGNFVNFGKIDFPVAASQQAPIVYVAIKPKGMLPWGGDLSSFTVQFSTTEKPADNTFDTASCTAPSRRRDVAAEANACESKTCGDCVADANCQYCYGKGAPKNACQAKATACPADSVPATKPQCTECVSKNDATTCSAVTNCKFCTGLSVGDIASACIPSWECATVTASTTVAGTGAGTSAAETKAAGDTTKKPKNDSKTGSTASTMALSVVSAILAIALAN